MTVLKKAVFLHRRFESGLFGAASAKLNLFVLPSRDEKPQKRSFCGNSSVGRARPCQGRGREFESRFPLTVLSNTKNHTVPGGLLGAARAEAKLALIMPSRDKKPQNFGTKFCGNSSVGRARPCQGRGREFESRFPLK